MSCVIYLSYFYLTQSPKCNICARYSHAVLRSPSMLMSSALGTLDTRENTCLCERVWKCLPPVPPDSTRSGTHTSFRTMDVTFMRIYLDIRWLALVDRLEQQSTALEVTSDRLHRIVQAGSAIRSDDMRLCGMLGAISAMGVGKVPCDLAASSR